jgi:serralysin
MPDGVEDLVIDWPKPRHGKQARYRGNGLRNRIEGSGIADNLDGDDSLIGGLGHDLLKRARATDQSGVDGDDTVIELAGEGSDETCARGAGADLRGEIEFIQLDDNAAGNVVGTDTDTEILGSYKDNTLRGLGGDDSLDGSAGRDRLKGGWG